ncbi:MAG: carbohydrate ABC transporter permease [Candidatus Binatia bacterium]|nr:carbohydrate ABC transporter permease [Candidatus Binatia bacterium]
MRLQWKAALVLLAQKGHRLLLHALLLVAAALTLAPLVWMCVASLMPAGEASQLPPRWWPSRVTAEHYRTLFASLHLGRNFFNSFFLATAATGLSLFCNSLAGYALAKLRFVGRDRVFLFLLALLVVPAQVGMLPLFLILRSFGWIDTYWGVLVPSLASVFGIFLVRQYAQSIPDGLLDAARVDGASELRVFWSVGLPLCRPILVTLGVFTFLGTWNDFLWPLIVLSDAKKQTLPVALASLAAEHIQETELMMASAVLTMLPAVALFLAVQRAYVAGIVSGALKF